MGNKENAYNELHKNVYEFICGLEGCCNYVAGNLIPLICKRAIRRMNNWKGEASVKGCKIKWRGKDALLCGDYPKSFSFFDILSIQIQNYSYDEINPYLRDTIEDVLNYEKSRLSSSEQIVLDYSQIREVECGKYVCDVERLTSELFSCFHDMLNEHYGTKKIESYTLNH